MLSIIQQNDFLTFLSYCLSPDSQALPECAARICWADLLQFAKKQSVVGAFQYIFIWRGAFDDHLAQPADICVGTDFQIDFQRFLVFPAVNSQETMTGQAPDGFVKISIGEINP